MQRFIIDVRTAEEYQAGHKVGALHIPLSDFVAGDFGVLKDVPKDTEIECYCLSGMRSERAKDILQANGYTQVNNLGGM